MEYATVVDGNLNMREDADIKSNRITLIPNGSDVAVLEKGDVWCKAVYNAYTGYVMTRFLNFENGNDDAVITISISKAAAKELYEALKLSLEA